MESQTCLQIHRAIVGKHASATDRDKPRRCALAVIAGSLALGCMAGQTDTGTSAASDGQSIAGRLTDPDLSAEAIQPLRLAAQVGDVNAALALATRLIERYERGSPSDDLFEATVWIDRYHGNETFARSGLLTRVQQRDCKHQVMRLHWLCDVAE